LSYQKPKKEPGEILHEGQVVLENDRKWLRRIELVTMEYCTCGGSGPGESDCSACAIWHEFREEWERKCL